MAVELVAKIIPQNDAFQGMVDNDQIVGVGAGFKDEDDMASDSAIAFASQQSIKKYVDDNAGASASLVEKTDDYLVIAGDLGVG